MLSASAGQLAFVAGHGRLPAGEKHPVNNSGAVTAEQAAVRPKILLTLGGGGHLAQALGLAEQLTGHADLYFVTASDSVIPGHPAVVADRVHRVSGVGGFSGSGVNSGPRRALLLAATFFESLRAVRAVQPHMVVGVATGMSLPLLLAARMLGKQTAFVESITRISSRTRTGRLLSVTGIAHDIYVQWPDAEKLYRRAKYAGQTL